MKLIANIKEVTAKLNPLDFNIQTMRSRLEKKGDLWKGILVPGIDMKSSLKLTEKYYPFSVEVARGKD